LPAVLNDDFELSFGSPITIIVGENGAGKSTLLEGIAVLAGYDEAGGGKGYMPVDHSNALEVMGGPVRCAQAGCQRSPMAGSSGPRVSFRLRDISMRSAEPHGD
jgi:predicted ATPase